MKPKLRLISLLVVISLNFVLYAEAEDWTQFLGPNGDSEARDCKPATSWSKDNFVWSTSVPGKGWSSPVYSKNYIWLTSAITQPATEEQIAKKRQGVQYANTKTTAGKVEFHAVCVDLKTGKLLRDVTLREVEEPELINPLNSYASPTPVISGDRVICHFGNYGTWCLNLTTGAKIWQTEFVVDHSVGPGSSPIVYKEKVILVCDGIDQQYIVAVNLADGKVVWKTNRPPMRTDNGEYQKAYSTPLIVNVKGNDQAIIPGAQWIASYDPESGRELWRVDHGDGFSVTPMASLENGLVIFSTGFMRAEILAVDPTGTGDVTSSHIKWRMKNGPNMPSMLTSNGKVYSISDRGIFSCIDATNGELINRKRIGGNFSSTPLLAGENIFLGNRDGLMTVVRCDQELEVVSTFQFDSTIMASPATIGDDLLIRTGEKLYRISN